jgi:hypothetical protein
MAFAGTVGLALVVMSSRRSASLAGHAQALPDWPIKFTLPNDYAWRRVPQMLVLESPEEGRLGFATVYVGRSSTLGMSQLQITFGELGDGATLKEASHALIGRQLKKPSSIGMGPAIGRMDRREMDNGRLILEAVSCLERGLSVAVTLECDARSGRSDQVFDEICGSICLVE